MTTYQDGGLMMKSRAWRTTSGVALVVLSLVVSAGAAQAVPGKDGKPDKPAHQQGKQSRPGGEGKPDKPARPAKGQPDGASGPTRVVFVCSYECLADGTCAWAVRAETRPLPVPVTPR